MGYIFPSVIARFADAIYDVAKGKPLDLILASPGGDAETALRMAQMCHSERKDFRVIVPDQAKSAATLLALGAEEIVMSDTSDLGPVDAQLWMPTRKEFVPAKGIIQSVTEIERKITDNPSTFEWYTAFISDIDAVTYQQALAASERTSELVQEVLLCRNQTPGVTQARDLAERLQSPAAHSAVVGWSKAKELGLPVKHLAPDSSEWSLLWDLYTRYHLLIHNEPIDHIIEGRRVSLIYVSA